MATDQGERHLRDTKVDVKVVLSSLWVTMLFVFAYIDIFGFFRADIINGALVKEVPGSGFTINERFLLLTTLYILVPSLMVAVSVLAPARANRTANLVVSLVYLLTVAASMIGESWLYYLVGSVVEIVLLAAIARTAWTWPSDHTASETASETASGETAAGLAVDAERALI